MLLVILLVVTFSFLGINTLRIKTFQSDTQTKQYQKIQANLHLEFAKKFILNLNLNNPKETCINKIKINNDTFKITADISYISTKSDCTKATNIDLNSTYSKGVATIDLYVESRSSIFKIKLHERFLKKL